MAMQIGYAIKVKSTEADPAWQKARLLALPSVAQVTLIDTPEEGHAYWLVVYLLDGKLVGQIERECDEAVGRWMNHR